MIAIEKKLNLSNMKAEWSYDKNSDAWTMSSVTAVTDPEIKEEQGVSVCVPGAYVKGIDTNNDGSVNKKSGTVKGNLVIDYDASVKSSNGQIYTAQTAPVIVNTGAAGYGEQQNQNANSIYAKDGYINVTCGNRGKQSKLSNGTYTGDAPSCLVDQKNAVRFVKYNILLGNLPGSIDYFVSTGGSGGGAHAAMIAATSDNDDFYDYEIDAGAVGVYKNSKGKYITSVTIDGKEYELTDGMWGCMAYSTITSLSEANMAQAFEYFLNPNYSFNTDFQKKMAEYLAEEYMKYINEKNISVLESVVGYDLNGDGKKDAKVALKIEYDPSGHAETNGYYGTYVDLYLAEFEQSLNEYLDRLEYADDWTWFNSEGKALSDSEVKAMTKNDKCQAFIEGRYAKGSTKTTNSKGKMGSGPSVDNAGGPPDMNGSMLEKNNLDSAGGPPDRSENSTDGNNMNSTEGSTEKKDKNQTNIENVGTPEAGTTQASDSVTDSANYSTFSEMLSSYKTDISSIESGDSHEKNIVELYDPLKYIGAKGTNNPMWTRILMGASEGDISMFNSLNMQIAWLNAGTDAKIEWQWDGGHVPSEILGDSLVLYVDMMYGKYVDGAKKITKPSATGQSKNGTATEMTGKDISNWVTYDSKKGATFSLGDIAAYRTSGACKAIQGFDVIDYGQEDYVFGNSEKDARHWDRHVLNVLEKHQEELSNLFN
ncbi:hypothetical protein SAMN04487761_14224 [Lachnospiraceae bacterium C7]|nr:hypothetical protein SAMN04487761_14224 [Lachnospiraceae bacterium C7]